MSEQIEKLLAQAHIELAPDSKAVTNRLAELIIRECAGVTLDYKNEEHYTGWCDHSAEILNHFGISDA